MQAHSEYEYKQTHAEFEMLSKSACQSAYNLQKSTGK
jgi:hypothetical protein